MSEFAKTMRGQSAKQPRPPLWKGPQTDGITFSMLSRFLTCRERFKAQVIDGWRPARTFNHRIEYGHLFHCAEEAHYGGQPWGTALLAKRDELIAKHRLDQPQIVHWWRVCSTQFQEYLRYWESYDASPEGLKAKDSVGQEEVFDVLHELPSGRVVRLRGKVDGLHRKPWTIRETKTKGEIDVQSLTRQLTFDLQTMLYCVAVGQKYNVKGPIKVLYNLVLRPLSGGKGSIRKHQPTTKNPKGESDDQFYARLGEVIRTDPANFFTRLAVQVQPTHVSRFLQRCLNPLLEQVCEWYDWVKWTNRDPFNSSDPATDPQYLHWQHPFGVRNMLDEGGHTDLDEYISTGSTVGLERVETLFEELT